MDADAVDQMETVTVLKSDFELLQKAADAAMEDFQFLCLVLGYTPDPDMAPREIVRTFLYPRIVALQRTQEGVDSASQMIERAKTKVDAKIIGLDDGRQAVRVGKRVPGLFLEKAPLSRRERRDWDRKHGV